MNDNTAHAIKEGDGGECKIHKTDVEPEPPDYIEQISENEIPITKLKKTVDEKCIICYADLKEGDEVYFLPCLHCFHVPCLREWFETNKTCPNCKYELQLNLQ